MADYIQQLPKSNVGPSEEDMRVMKSLFGESVMTYEMKRLILPTIAFFVLSLPIVDDFLKKLIPTTSGIFLIVKAAIFLLIIVIAQMFGLA